MASHPPWKIPESNSLIYKELKVYNSLTSSLVNFHPINGKTINWYACGPTVYASAHLGHARAYMTFDIIRRIMEDYFCYDVNYVMNVTDIDDKIILRARRNHLLDNFFVSNKTGRKNGKNGENIFQILKEAIKMSIKNSQETLGKMELEIKSKNKYQKEELVLKHKGESSKLKNLKKAKNELYSAEKSVPSKEFLQLIKEGNNSQHKELSDSLASHLDLQIGEKVIDLSIFKNHSQKFETEFFTDLKNLGIKEPDCLTRVTEYIGEIIEFIKGILSNGFAYESNGSVYFDISSFRSSGHHYPKLRPKQFGNNVLLNEAEGSLSKNASDKKSSHDFALWKKSRGGEPHWDSPWGKGRPGWHIECSVMASKTLGKTFDIHSGGEDLCFPHHDNEMAQAEAFYHKEGVTQWVNYFLHAGHLGIDGLKMAKSLKNFITIKEALKTNTARQIRLCFLLQTWNKKMDYSTLALEEAVSKEKYIIEFIANCQATKRKHLQIKDTIQKWTEEDETFNKEIIRCQNCVYSAFCNNFDYSSATHILFDLMKTTNKYLSNPKTPRKSLLISKALNYVIKIFKTLGVLDNDLLHHDKIAFQSLLKEDLPEFNHLLYAFCLLRKEIREVCISEMKLRKKAQKLSKTEGTKTNEKVCVHQISTENKQKIEKSAEKCRKTVDFGLNKRDISKSKTDFKTVLEENHFHLDKSDISVLENCDRFLVGVTKGISEEKDPKYFLKLADRLRDEDLLKYGVRLEDGNDTNSVMWKRCYGERINQ